jgi:hypothetical protein
MSSRSGFFHWYWVAVFVASSLALHGCSGRASSGTAHVGREGGDAALEERHVEEKPEVAAIVREGDPRAGLALRIGVDSGVEDTLGLSALMASRLSGVVAHFQVEPGLDSVAVVGALEASNVSADELRAIVSALDSTLRATVQPSETEAPAFTSNLRRVVQQYLGTDWSLERQGCLGETTTERSLSLVATPDLAGRLERLRHHVFGRENARFGVVGSADIVSGVVHAVEGIPDWPSAEALRDARPAADGVDLVKASPEALSVLLRVGEAERIFALERELLGNAIGPQRLSVSKLPGIRIRRVRASALRRGGCLRVDLEPSSLPSTDTSVAALLTAARLLVESASASPEVKSEWARLAMARAALEQSSSMSAAVLATEVSLSEAEPKRPDTVFVQLHSSYGGVDVQGFGGYLLNQVLGNHAVEERIPTLVRIEPGQGKIHVLLASPCMPANEPKRLLGSTALFLSAIAEHYSGLEGVTLKPWVTSQGAGLFASTGKLHPKEPSDEQVERLGRVLGQAIAFLPDDNQLFWRQRATQLARLGPGRRPALWQAILALAPERPGLVIQEGTFDTVESVQPLELRERARLFASEELRAALVVSEAGTSVPRFERALMRWLGPLRGGAKRCPIATEVSALTGDLRLESGPVEQGDAPLTLTYVLPSAEPEDAIYAEWLQRLLDGSGGWLDRVSRAAHLAAEFDVAVVGGSGRRGLVLAVGVTESQLDAVLGAISTGFADLGRGVKPENWDLAPIEQWHRARELRRLSEPSERLVELWSARAPSPKVTEAGFLAYLRRAFASNKPFVVRATSKPEKLDRSTNRAPAKANSATAKPRSKATSSPRR